MPASILLLLSCPRWAHSWKLEVQPWVPPLRTEIPQCLLTIPMVWRIFLFTLQPPCVSYRCREPLAPIPTCSTQCGISMECFYFDPLRSWRWDHWQPLSELTFQGCNGLNKKKKIHSLTLIWNSLPSLCPYLCPQTLLLWEDTYSGCGMQGAATHLYF